MSAEQTPADLDSLAGWSAHDLILQCGAWSRKNHPATWIADVLGVWIGARVYWADRGDSYLHLTIARAHEDRLLAVLPEAEPEKAKLQSDKLSQYRVKLPPRLRDELER